MKKIILKEISILMICLIIALPIYTANVYSVTGVIRNMEIKGENNIPNMISSDDVISIIVEARIYAEDSTITPNMVKLDANGMIVPFNKQCTKLDDDFYKCEHSKNVFMPANKYGLKVKLYDSEGTQLTEEFDSYYVDGLAPEIDIQQQPVQEGDVAKLSYIVHEKACEGTLCLNKCSGIKSIEINGKEVEAEFDKCWYQEDAEIPLTKEGKQTISIIAVDNQGHIATKTTEDIKVDLSAPKLDNLEFKIGDAEVDYISGSGTKVNMIADIEDNEEIDTDSVQADLSELNAAYAGTNYQPNKYQKSGKTYRFIWEDISINPGEKTQIQPTIKIIAKDDKGNKLDTSKKFTFSVDSQAPETNTIGTDKCDEKYCYIKPGKNKFLATMKEAGSGFNLDYPGKGVVFDLSEIPGLEEQNFARANDCIQKGSLWECYGGANVSESAKHLDMYKIYLTDATKDDVGNIIKGKQDAILRVDNKDPIITATNIYAIGEQGQKQYFQANEHMTVEAYIEDDTTVSAYGNFSEITGKKEPIAAKCSEQVNSSLHYCIWEEIGPLSSLGQDNKANLKLTFKDIVDNSIEYEKEIRILESQDGTPNYWSISNKRLLPSKLDKQTIPLTNMQVYTNLGFTPSTSNIKILEASLEGCEGDMDYFASGNNPSLVYAGGNDTLVKINIRRQGIAEDVTRFKLNCTFGLITEVNQRYVTNKEYETIGIEIPLYNMPLGTIDSGTQSLIEEAKDNGLYKLADKLKWMEKLLEIADKGCQIYQVVTTIELVFAIFKQGISALYNPPETPSMFASVNKVLSKFCEWGSCSSANTHLSERLLGISYHETIGQVNWDKYNNLMKDGKEKQAFEYVNEVRGVAEEGFFGIKLQKTLEDRGFSDVGMWPKNPEDSLVLSILTLCPAGISRNLKKYRQINCMYIDCLQNKVPYGMPVSACQDQFQYLQCAYIYGEAFQVIPFVHIWKRFSGEIKDLLSDPVSLAFGSSEYFCKGSDTGPCKIFKLTKKIGYITQQIDRIKSLRNGITLDIPESYDACSAIGED